MTMMPFHDGLCTGAECLQCYPSLTRLQDTSCFRDGRGKPVERFPDVLRPSTTIILVHGAHWDEGPPWQVLVHQRADNGWWGFPGGAQECGESILDCAMREAHEETGYEIYMLGATSIDSDPHRNGLVVYPDTIVQYTNVTFLAQVLTGTLQISGESTALRWASTDALPEPFMPSHRWRLAMAMLHHGPFLPVR